MSHKDFAGLINQWQEQATDKADLVPEKIALHAADIIKLAALSEIYQLPREDIAAELLRRALLAMEEEMPYIPGSKVIRVEEGNPIYEDIGPLPKYLAAKQRLTEDSAK